MDDLLDADLGKHDYDWLLTPPGTPRVPSVDATEKPLSSTVPKRNTVRSSSTTRSSRLSASQPENGPTARPVRSSSVSRPSISSSYLSNNNRTSVLNTSSASVTSRPSTPGKRAGSLTATRPLTPVSRPGPTRSSTPVKTRSSASSTGVKAGAPQNSRPSTPTSRPRTTSNPTDGASQHSRPSTPTSRPHTTSNPTDGSSQNSRPSTPTSRPRLTSNPSSGALQNSRPSTPSSRPRITSNLTANTNPTVARPSSRSSTPTRRSITPSSAPTVGRLPSVGRIPATGGLTSVSRIPSTSGRNSAPSSRPSSPSPRPRAPVRPLDIPDFPNDTPPNLRTKLPERPSSAGRVRPGMALTVRGSPNSEPSPVGSNKRISLPIVTRSKFPENPPRASLPSNGHQAKPLPEAEARRSARPSTTTESTGFGRTISKKSLDMALRHMDIRQNIGGIRGASLFPHSIRSSAAKGRPARMSDPVVPLMNDDEAFSENGGTNGMTSRDCNGAVAYNGGMATDNSPDRESTMTRETSSELDVYGSSRYDAMFLREDSKNTNWLHSIEDKADQSPVFDHRFEPLPEPFGPL
ncbi:uncharacterized protein [Typha angustifolia]|uniref:uncharacterized protein n=1 Tax=Typha angustifolia TaxID=59011 RepID=UPI003C2DC13F